MSIVDAVTAGATVLAAILSGLNLYLSGRRELDHPTREALEDAFVKFLDTRYNIGVNLVLVPAPIRAVTHFRVPPGYPVLRLLPYLPRRLEEVRRL